MANESRKMVVLGAGASIGSKRYPINSSLDQLRDRMPSAENFFYDLFKLNKTENHNERFLNFLGLTYEALYDVIVRAWNINKGNNDFDPNGWRGVNIEEVMTFFDVGSNMFDQDSQEGKLYRQAQKSLLDFMFPLIPMICEGQHCEYLLRVFFGLEPKDTVISYNWDTIAEYTLAKAKANQIRNYAKLMRSDKIEPRMYRNTGLLLKLHGSFNWMVCKNPECPSFDTIKPPFQKNRYKLIGLNESYTCKDCGSNNLRPLIVPPVSNKMIHKDEFLKNQWLIAREKLLDTNELIFIGYSFPPTDYYSEWLFRQIYFIENRNDIKITVVNPQYGKRGSAVTKRYDTIFNDFEIESYKTLKDFAERN
ncbi:hypothetical protein K1F50_15730 [Muricauda oceani]|uniref:SIR2-like domain-containing protein n=1 Tax=Flagellimonas oceani TaxID=2698672 RepID=A0A6G7J0W5_9FLAO|nr:hypothetical protein [Allomuricauda oceani]MBW8244259.1 hypothetical protein [Allomuricauda oceani]QII44092.1 hypothetical protein GVT53_05200 [Allomuricauda oceani]